MSETAPLRLVPIWYLTVFERIRYLMLATQIPSNTWVFDSSCLYIRILVGFEQLSLAMFVKPQCTLDNLSNLSIQGCQRYQRYLMCSHMVANSCRGYFTVLWIETSSIRNTQYLRYWGYLSVFKIWSECFHMVVRRYCNIVEYRQIPPNTIWEQGLTGFTWRARIIPSQPVFLPDLAGV